MNAQDWNKKEEHEKKGAMHSQGMKNDFRYEYNSLDGNLPEKIANFSYLETLKLGDNKITGSIPDVIFNMSSLIEIILRYNNISGKLPYNICSNTPKLRIMSLSGTQLNGEIPANIYKCRGLEDLRLPKNHFSGRHTTRNLEFVDAKDFISVYKPIQ
ncbi:hypothetical protein ACS0TY_028409 [Phlomoides rotata]